MLSPTLRRKPDQMRHHFSFLPPSLVELSLHDIPYRIATTFLFAEAVCLPSGKDGTKASLENIKVLQAQIWEVTIVKEETRKSVADLERRSANLERTAAEMKKMS
ncbi:hypothetical protein U1Q18_026688 [Sarracenia purpurea var. burkii]